jgi:hypothetical protein
MSNELSITTIERALSYFEQQVQFYGDYMTTIQRDMDEKVQLVLRAKYSMSELEQAMNELYCCLDNLLTN